MNVDVALELAFQFECVKFLVRESKHSFTGSVAEVWLEKNVHEVAYQFAVLVGRDIVSRRVGACWVLSVPVSF